MSYLLFIVGLDLKPRPSEDPTCDGPCKCVSYQDCNWSKTMLDDLTHLANIDGNQEGPVFKTGLRFFNNKVCDYNKRHVYCCNNNQHPSDEQVEKLVSRCNRITNLSLDGNMELTDASLTSIINHLKHSLVALSIACDEISFEKVLELKSMPKLRVLNYGFKSWHTMVLRKKLPHLKVNQLII